MRKFLTVVVVLAVLAGIAWYIGGQPSIDEVARGVGESVGSVRESFDEGVETGRTSDSASSNRATPTATVAPSPTRAPSPTPLPSSSREIAFVFDAGYGPGVPAPALAVMREDMLDMINSERRSAGSPPVSLGNNASPQVHTEYMRDNCIVSHSGPGGIDKRARWLSAGGASSVILGENVNGYRDCSFRVPRSRTLYHYVDKLMDSLMDSSGHRNILLGPKYDEVHLGFAISPNGMWVTQLFVDRR